MNFSVQHLSDEAVAAFADGYLRAVARNRAARHLAECAECAHSVAVQREAACALRCSGTGPADRVARQAASGSGHDAAAAGSGDAGAGRLDGLPRVRDCARSGLRRMSAMKPASKTSLPISPPVGRRTQHLALATAAVALVAIGVAASSPSAATTHPGTGQSNTQGGTGVVPAVYPVPSPPTGAGDDSMLLRGNTRPSRR